MFQLGTPGDFAAASTRPAEPSDVIAGGNTLIPQKFYHPNAGRNALGLVGGNEVSMASGNLVDLESDLYGITRDLSKAPSKQYRPTCPLGGPASKELQPIGATDGPSALKGNCPAWPGAVIYTERATAKVRTVNTAPRHLPTIQMFSYPGVPAPDPFVQEVYGAPWRF